MTGSRDESRAFACLVKHSGVTERKIRFEEFFLPTPRAIIVILLANVKCLLQADDGAVALQLPAFCCRVTGQAGHTQDVPG